MSADETLPLLSSTSATSSLKASNSATEADSDGYLKTYSAGEDARRLAAVAKELGLQKYRKPKPQVRQFGDTIAQVLPIMAFKDKSNQYSTWETIAGVAGNVLEWYDFAGTVQLTDRVRGH